jgi:hypothetical protein
MFVMQVSRYTSVFRYTYLWSVLASSFSNVVVSTTPPLINVFSSDVFGLQ